MKFFTVSELLRMTDKTRWPEVMIEGTDGQIYGTASGGNSTGRNHLSAWTRTDIISKSFCMTLLAIRRTVPHRRERFGRGADGLLYGTTSSGGSLFGGTLFTMHKDGSDYSLLHEFDGGYPKGTLVQGSNGVLYGTTSGGGANFAGTIFSWNTKRNGIECPVFIWLQRR